MLNTVENQTLLNNFGLVQPPVTVGQGMANLTTAAQPLTLPYAPALLPFVPQVVPAPVYNVYENIPGNADFYILTPSGPVKAAPAQYCNFQNGNYVAPNGWSLLPIEVYYRYGLNLVPFPAGEQPLAPFDTTPSVGSRSPTPEKEEVVFAPKDQNIEKTVKEASPEPVSNAKNTKRPHRAKQIKITKIHTIVKDECIRKGIFADENEVLRGETVLRIHVKTWEGLDLIQDVLDEVEQAVHIDRIALPFSMKNKFQKKGFILYLKVSSLDDVDRVKSIFAQYSDAFKKCDVALPTNRDPLSSVAAPKTPEKKEIMQPFFADFDVPVMTKRMSAA